MSKLGLAYFALEQLDKSLEALEKALDIRRKYHVHGNLEVAKLYNNIAAIYYQKGDKKAAMKKFKEAFKMMKKLIEGPVRRSSLVYDTATIISNMGKIYLERKKYDSANQKLAKVESVPRQVVEKKKSWTACLLLGLYIKQELFLEIH